MVAARAPRRLPASGRDLPAAHRAEAGVVNKETWIAVKATSSDFFPPIWNASVCGHDKTHKHGTTSTRQPTLQHTQVTTRLVVSTLTGFGA